MKSLLLLAGLLAACATPSTGTKCDAGVAYCSSPTAALSCQAGTLQPFTCTGPKGCALGANRAVLCDQSAGATAGLPCFPEYEGKGQCGTDGGTVLRCNSGSWAAVACPQGTRCSDDGGVACR